MALRSAPHRALSINSVLDVLLAVGPGADEGEVEPLRREGQRPRIPQAEVRVVLGHVAADSGPQSELRGEVKIEV